MAMSEAIQKLKILEDIQLRMSFMKTLLSNFQTTFLSLKQLLSSVLALLYMILYVIGVQLKKDQR
jgi:hypothetical protein